MGQAILQCKIDIKQQVLEESFKIVLRISDTIHTATYAVRVASFLNGSENWRKRFNNAVQVQIQQNLTLLIQFRFRFNAL